MRGRNSARRLYLVAGVSIVPFLLTFLRVGWLQVVQGEVLRERAESQHVVRVWLPPHRGAIVDRRGEPLAYSMFDYSIVAEPAKVKDPRATARVLAEALHTSSRSLERKLRSRNRLVYLERRVTPTLGNRVDLRSLPGVTEKLELKRVYPQGPAAAHVVGFLDHGGHGRAGVEGAYDELLRGHPGWTTELRDGLGNSYSTLGRRSKPARTGHRIELTLDAGLQDVAASVLSETVARLRARGGSFVAVEPRSGDVLAMVSCPTFDPERVREAKKTALRNRAVVDPYEPGSTFKLVAAAAALEDEMLTPQTVIHCENGRYNFGGFWITDHHGYGALSLRDCFAVSSNIAFAKVGQGCGPRLYDVAQNLGFGSPTGISLAGEASGVLHAPEEWSGRSSATIAIGYEVMTTPLQLAMGYAAVANDGVLMRPRLVRSITDPDGRTVYRSEPEEVRRALSSEVAATLRSFMQEVVREGTGTVASLTWAEVGGKTGTTEKYIKGSGYDSRRHYASFVGIVPIQDPEIVCFVMIDEPQGLSAFGGSAAAPVFREVMEAWGRFPGASISPPHQTLVVKPPPSETRRGIGPSPLEAGTENRSPETPSPARGVPDVRGVSLRQALQTLQAHGLGARVEGTGVVKRQIPPPGAPLPRAVALVCSRRSRGEVILASGSGTSGSGRRGGGVQAPRGD